MKKHKILPAFLATSLSICVTAASTVEGNDENKPKIFPCEPISYEGIIGQGAICGFPEFHDPDDGVYRQGDNDPCLPGKYYGEVRYSGALIEDQYIIDGPPWDGPCDYLANTYSASLFGSRTRSGNCNQDDSVYITVVDQGTAETDPFTYYDIASFFVGNTAYCGSELSYKTYNHTTSSTTEKYVEYTNPVRDCCVEGQYLAGEGRNEYSGRINQTLVNEVTPSDVFIGETEVNSNTAWAETIIDNGNGYTVTGKANEFTAEFSGLEIGAEYCVTYTFTFAPWGEEGCEQTPKDVTRTETFVAETCTWEITDDYPLAEWHTTTLKTDEVYIVKTKDAPLLAGGGNGSGNCSGGDCAGNGGPGAGGPGVGSYHFRASLGQTDFGEPAGSVYVQQEDFSPDSVNPRSLQVSAPSSEVDIVYGEYGVRQIIAPQTFVDVEIVDEYGFRIDFYKPDARDQMDVDGSYKIDAVAEPLVSWEIYDPHSLGGQPMSLMFERYEGIDTSPSRVSQVTYSPGSGEPVWTLDEEFGERVTEVTHSTDANGNPVKSVEISDGNGVAKTYETSASGVGNLNILNNSKLNGDLGTSPPSGWNHVVLGTVLKNELVESDDPSGGHQAYEVEVDVGRALILRPISVTAGESYLLAYWREAGSYTSGNTMTLITTGVARILGEQHQRLDLVDDEEWAWREVEYTASGTPWIRFGAGVWGDAVGSLRLSRPMVVPLPSWLDTTDNEAVQAFLDGAYYGASEVEKRDGITMLTRTNYGDVSIVERPFGRWERLEYDEAGRLEKTIRPFESSDQQSENDAEHRVEEITRETVDLSYDGYGGGYDDERITTVERALGVEVGRTYTINWGEPVEIGSDSFRKSWTIRCLDPGAVWSNPGNLVTETLTHVGGPFSGKTYSVVRPDGTATLYSYSINDVPDVPELTTIRKSGRPVLNSDNYQNPELDSSGYVIDIDMGRKSETIRDLFGTTMEQREYDIESTILLSEAVSTPNDIDAFGRVEKIEFLDDTTLERTYECCGLKSVTDREGITTDYEHDDLGRVDAEIRDGIRTEYKLDAVGRKVEIKRVGTDSTEMVLQTTNYVDPFTWTVNNANNDPRSYSSAPDSEGREIKTVTYEDGGQREETYHFDGSLKEVAGDAAHPRKYEYGVSGAAESPAESLFVKEIRPVEVNQVWIEDEWVKTYRDLLGRVTHVEYPDGATEKRGYNDDGQLQWTEDPDGVTNFFKYNDLGDRSDSAVFVSGPTPSGDIAYAGDDRITRIERDYLPGSGNPHGDLAVQRVQTWVWGTTGDNPEVARTVYTTVRGIRHGQATWTDEYDKVTGTLIEFAVDENGDLLNNGTRTETTTDPNSNYTVHEYENGRLVDETTFASNDVELASVDLAYDDHQRLWRRTESGTGTTEYEYYVDDSVKTITTPDPSSSKSGTGWDPQETTFVYDKMGRQEKITYHDDAEENFDYFPTGELKKRWGDRTYPVEYVYDNQGRRTKMTTWEDHDTLSGAAVTEWEYDPQRGWLDKKIHPGGNGPEYTYTDAGRLETREWARGVVTTYGYTDAGDLETITYTNDPAGTPSVSYEYNRLGEIDEVTVGTDTRKLEYTDRGKLHREQYTSGPLTGRAVEHNYDPDIGRLTSIKMTAMQTVLHTQTYSYHSTNNRLDKVSQGNYNVNYGYKNQTYRMTGATFKRNTTYVEDSGRNLDNFGRVVHSYLGPDWLTSNAPLMHESDYNDANQSVAIERNGIDEPTWRWEHVYDSLGQVTSAARHWGGLGGSSDPVQGQQYAYTFDDIGNRTQTTTNGQTADYTLATASSSGLNQYAERDVPDVIDVLGFSLYDSSQSILGVNGDTAQHRRENYFHHQLGNLGNSTSDLFEEVEVIEYQSGSPIASDSGYYFVAEDPEEFDYDLDGNLTSDGRWEYKWDGENRLIEIEEIRTAGIQDVTLRKLELFYDDQGRKVRTQQRVWNTNTQTWSISIGRHYAYSGFNIIGEGNVNPFESGDWNIQKTYLWGLDESEKNDYRITGGWSSIGRASGGVGGLLLVSRHQFPSEAHFVHHDANGNVVALIDADGNGEISAIYDYGPFGNLIRASGEAAELNPFRFSTKYHHEFYGLYYYGFRFYSPSQGRFLNRDPIEEQGGLNLYAFVGNDPVNRWDYLGKYWFPSPGIHVDPRNFPDEQIIEGAFSYVRGNARGVVALTKRSGALGSSRRDEQKLRNFMLLEVAKKIREDPDVFNACYLHLNYTVSSRPQHAVTRLGSGFLVSGVLTVSAGKAGSAGGLTLNINALYGDLQYEVGDNPATKPLVDGVSSGIVPLEHAKEIFEFELDNAQRALNLYFDLIRAGALGDSS